MRRLKTFVRVWTVLIFAVLAGSVFCAASGDAGVISLRVNDRVVDDYFEVLPERDTILVPLVAIGRYAGIAVDWKPAEGVASFKRPADRETGLIEVNVPMLKWGSGKVNLFSPAPQLSGGVLYVPLAAITNGFGISAEWDFSRQQLSLTVPESQVSEPTAGRPLLDLPIIKGVSSSSGTTAFDLSIAPETDGHRLTLTLQGKTRQEGGQSSWVTSFTSVSGEPGESFGPSVLTFNFRSDDFELRLGDGTMVVPGHVPGVGVRGILFGLPRIETAETGTGTTYWTGEVDEGSTVELFVNGVWFGTQTDTGTFEFLNIPLNGLGVTRLTLKITDPDGAVETRVRTVSATLAGEPPWQSSISVVAAFIPDESLWTRTQGSVLAFDLRQGLSHGLTTRAVVMHRIGEFTGADETATSDLFALGILVMATDQFAAQLELMVDSLLPDGEVDRTYGRGWRLTTQWQLGRGALQAILSGADSDIEQASASVPPPGLALSVAGTWHSGNRVSAGINGAAHLDAGREWTGPWAHQVNLWGHWNPSALLDFSAAGGWTIDDTLLVPVSGHAALSAVYSGGPATVKLEGGWMSPALPGKPEQYYADATLVLVGEPGIFDAAFNVLTGVSASMKASSSWTLPIGQRNTMRFSGVWQHPAEGSGSPSLTAGGMWQASRPGAICTSVGAFAVTEFGNVQTALYPQFQIGVSRAGSALWSLQLEIKAPPNGPSVKVWFRLREDFMSFPGQPVLTPTGVQADSAAVAGVVFRDDNGNGQKDPGEPGVAGVVVMLGSRKTVTSANGVYVFTGLQATEYRLDIDGQELPIQYAAGAGPWQVELEEGQRAWNNIPLRLWGTVSGRVYVDVNDNGQYDEGDWPVAGAQIMTNGQPSGFYTDEEGFYLIEGLAAGTYIFTLDRGVLPEGSPQPVPVQVVIKANQPDAQGADLVLVP